METENSFIIKTQSGDTENSIKDDITEFLGAQVEPYLKPEDCICEVCIIMLDDIIRIKRKILEVMINPTDNNYSIKFGKYWKFLAKAIKHIDETEHYEPITPSSLTPSSPSERWSGNPERRKRSQSKASIRSINDEEVAIIFKQGKTGPKRPKSAGGTSKVKQKLLRSIQSENDRSKSSVSALNAPTLIFGEDKELLRSQTRAVSRVLQKSFCNECSEDLKEMELYTLHMMDCHGYIACYNCIDCGCSFMTDEHLKIHQNMHNDIVLCTICGSKQESVAILQKHTDTHIQYSVPCSYCGLAFLSKYDRNMHVFSHHRSKKHKTKSQKQYRIKEQINSNEESNDQKEPWDNNFSTKQYESLYMILDIKEKPEFHGKTYEELDYRMRNPEPVIRNRVPAEDRELTSLGDDIVVSEEENGDSISEPPPSITESEIQRQTDQDRDLSELDLAALDKDSIDNIEEHSIQDLDNIEEHSIQDLQEHGLSDDQDRLQSPQMSLYENVKVDEET